MGFLGGRRIFACLAAAGVSCVLALLSAGGASALAASTTTGPNAAALHSLGLKVSWPLKQSQTTLAPGARLTVAVTNLRSGSRRVAVTVSLESVSSSGQVLATVASQRLYAGSARFTLPAGAARDYRLALSAANLSYSSAVVTAPAAAGSTPATEACTETQSGLDPNPVQAGADINETVTDTGSDDCSLGFGASFQEDVNGQWVDAPTQNGTCVYATPAVAVVIKPGSSFQLGATVPQWFASGEYRVSISGLPAQEIQVTADPGYDPSQCDSATGTGATATP